MPKIAGPAIAIIVFVVGTVVAETFLAVFSPLPDPYQKYKYFSLNQFIRSEFPINYRMITEVEPGLAGIKGQNTFSTNNMGFRGDYLVRPKPKEEFRIFMIGGSTTECLYLDDSESISAVLQSELRTIIGTSVKVYNAGKSGDASDDHISMLVHRIVHLEPDLIIIFAGLNDLLRSISSHDYLHYLKRTTQLERYPFLHLVATEFQIPRRVYYALKNTAATEQNILERVTLKSDYAKKIALRKAARISNERPRADTRPYSNNLRTIYGVTKAHGIELVFMTQQSTWASRTDREVKQWHWMLNRGGIAYREDRMNEALESFNTVMRQIAREYAVRLYDLAESMPKSLEFFYDDVHFNVKGSRTAAKELVKYVFPESHGP